MSADPRPTALIADDEPLLREALVRLLAAAWPELRVVAQARHGRDAIEKFDALHPTVCFLDVHMPGLTGIDVAHHIGRRAHLVFVTAFDKYAVQAFAAGVLDYLVKPVEAERLADTVRRLKERLGARQPAVNTEELLQRLAEQMRSASRAPSQLRWLRASIGATVRLIDVLDVDYLRAEDKYTRVAWRVAGSGPSRDAILRMPLKDLLPQLDETRFAQVHRGIVVNLKVIDHVTRTGPESAEIHLAGRAEVLPVSRSYLHLFRQM